MLRFILKKILIGMAVLVVSILLAGCNMNIFAPRPRMGTLPTPPPGPRFSDPNNLGRHSYYLNPAEKNGILYTNKAGHVDLTHLRWNADYTKYLTKKTYKTLLKKRKGFSLNLAWEPSRHRIEFSYPENWDDLSKKEKEKIIVGVNAFEMEHEPIPLLKIDESVAQQHLRRLKEVKKTRNNTKVTKSLTDLKKAAEDEQNLMPFILKSVKAYATLGEIIDALKEVYGEYQEPVTY